MIRAACTIVSLNYLPYARTLCDSYLEFHPDHRFYVLLVDRLPEGVDLSRERFELVLVENLGIPNFESVAFKYDILELNTNVKPTFLKHLLEKGYKKVIYFDPDIAVYNRVDCIYELLDSYSAVVTPHSLSPVNDPQSQLEQSLLNLGVFNLGFIAVSQSKQSMHLLEWWEQRCLRLGFCEARSGLFVDQKWMNLAPCFFPGVHILRHAGCNLAYWNLHERHLTESRDGYRVNNEVPLLFFHFSGVDFDHLAKISSKDPSGLTFSQRPDLVSLFHEYKLKLTSHGMKEFRSFKYSFGNFSNGEPISSLARRIYSSMAFSGGDPFSETGEFYKFAKRNRLIGDPDSSHRYDSRSYNRADLRVRFINGAFRLLATILGSDKYSMLLKYLSFITIPRNQCVLFEEGRE